MTLAASVLADGVVVYHLVPTFDRTWAAAAATRNRQELVTEVLHRCSTLLPASMRGVQM